MQRSTVRSGYRVLHVTPFFPPERVISGMATHVSNLCSCLIKEGNSISVIAPRRITNQRFDSASLEYTHRIRSLYLPGWPYPTLRSISIPIDLGLKIRSLIRNGGFDVVHAHGHHFPISWIAVNAAEKYGIPSVLTLHNNIYSLNPFKLGAKTRFEEFFNVHIFTRFLSQASAVVGLTEEMTEFAKRFGKGHATKYLTIPNGVNTRLYKKNLYRKKEYRFKYKLGEESTVILFCGRFEHIKGIIEFSAAIKKIMNNNSKEHVVEVVIIGSGTLEAEVRSILHQVEGVHIMGRQPPYSIHEIYIASDIFVNPSKSEALPIAIIEAMNAGLHIVCTEVGGVRDILKGYSPKTTLANTSVEEIQRVLTTLIIKHEYSLAKADSLLYAQKFDWDNIASDTIQVYDTLHGRSC